MFCKLYESGCGLWEVLCGWICYVGNAKCLLASGRGRTSGEAGLLGPAEQHKLSSEHHNLKLETKAGIWLWNKRTKYNFKSTDFKKICLYHYCVTFAQISADKQYMSIVPQYCKITACMILQNKCRNNSLVSGCNTIVHTSGNS